MSFFRKSVDHEIQAAALGCMLCCCGLIGHPPRAAPARRSARCPGSATSTRRSCCICPATAITLEHAWFLGQVLSNRDEYVLASCPDCRAAWIRDTLDVLPYNCATCRAAHLPDSADEDC